MSSNLLTSYLELHQNGGAKNSVPLPDPPPRSKINSIIMNYLITEGYKDAAEKFQQEANVEIPLKMENMDDRIRIRDAIQSGNIPEAIVIVNKLYPELLDENRILFFHMQQQQLIELIRNGSIEEALTFASENLAEKGEEDPSILKELERTMALLAFDDPANCPFEDLLAISHRHKVASEMNEALLRAQHAEQVQPKITNLLKHMLWAQEELDRRNVIYTKEMDLNKFQENMPK